MTEAADLPCVFGQQVMKDCPVQIFLLTPNLEKYKQITDPDIQKARAMGEVLASANNMTFVQLGVFCQVCPYLHAFKQRELKK